VNIFIDESGTFVNSPDPGSWNVVAALTVAETGRSVIANAVHRAREMAGAGPNEEIKLNRLDERAYVDFLGAMRHPDLAVFATATDAGLNSLERVLRHQAIQVANIRERAPHMRHEEARVGVELLATQVESISPQLYVQLVCQVNLFHDVIDRAINYFAQRRPATLREFRWRIDQKNSTRTTFEDAFEKIVPVLLQTRSIRAPFNKVEGFDYRAMKPYEFVGGKAPEYLQAEYGLPEMQGFNVQKLVRENLDFVDSKSVDGVQAADLIASGLRRLLRGYFSDNTGMARAIGSLFVQAKRGSNAISLTTFAPDEALASPHVSAMVRAINHSSKRMIRKLTAGEQ
jgi:hypothetical protein